MLSLTYHVVDTFTTTPFSGNPAAVFLLPSSTPTLSESTLQKIAAELNLPATAFVCLDDSTPYTYNVRWFTPTAEIPLCGHGTVAAAHLLFGTSGGVDLNFKGSGGVLVARKVSGSTKIELEIPAVPLVTLHDFDLEMKLGEALKEAARWTIPIEEVKQWGDFLLVHVDEAFDLEAATIDPAPFTKMLSNNIILTSDRKTNLRPDAKFVSRVFGPKRGVPEDWVCGAAHSGLTQYWSDVFKIPAGTVIPARQVSPRGGDIDVVNCAKDQGIVKLRGDAVLVQRGEIFIP